MQLVDDLPALARSGKFAGLPAISAGIDDLGRAVGTARLKSRGRIGIELGFTVEPQKP